MHDDIAWDDSGIEYGCITVSEAVTLATALGVDTLLFRVPGGAELRVLIGAAEAAMDQFSPG